MEEKQKKHVCVIQNVELGTTEALSVFLTNLSKSFPNNKEMVELIVSDSKNAPQELIKRVNGIYTTHTKLYSILENLVFGFRGYAMLKRINRKKRIDVLHCIRPNSSLLAAVLFKIFSNWKIKIVYNVRGPWIDVAILRKHIKPIYSELFKVTAYTSEYLLTRFVWKFVFVGNALKEYYTKKLRLQNKKMHIIPPGVDTSQFFFTEEKEIRDTWQDNPQTKILGHVGGLAHERDLGFIISSFELLMKENLNFKLIFIGDGPARQKLEKQVVNAGLQNKVIFTGRIQRSLIQKYISSIDIGISHLPDTLAYRCSYPLKILEYLACSKPVLASNIVAHFDIANILTGVTLYDLKKEFLKEKAILISKSSTNRQAKFREQILKYDWKNLASQYHQLYD